MRVGDQSRRLLRPRLTPGLVEKDGGPLVIAIGGANVPDAMLLA